MTTRRAVGVRWGGPSGPCVGIEERSGTGWKTVRELGALTRSGGCGFWGPLVRFLKASDFRGRDRGGTVLLSRTFGKGRRTSKEVLREGVGAPPGKYLRERKKRFCSGQRIGAKKVWKCKEKVFGFEKWHLLAPATRFHPASRHLVRRK